MPHIQIYLCLNTFILQQEKALLLHAEQNSTEERKILPFQAELYLGRVSGADSWLHLRAVQAALRARLLHVRSKGLPK